MLARRAMSPRLRIPAALAFTVLGAGVAASSCGTEKPTVDAGCVFCVYETVDNSNCPPPTCATGSQQDECPPGCIPAPVA
jgi:hypothetical protein